MKSKACAAPLWRSELALHCWPGVDPILLNLMGSPGQRVTADGAVQQLDNKDLAERVKAHTNARGGIVRGAPGTLLALPE